MPLNQPTDISSLATAANLTTVSTNVDDLENAVARRGFPNILTVDPDLSQAAWNTVAQHRVATVAGGIVEVCVIIEVLTNHTSGGAPTLDTGFTGQLAYWVAGVPLASLTAGTLVNFDGGSATANHRVAYNANTATLFDQVYLGSNITGIGYRVNVAAFTGGTQRWRFYWRAITTGATLTAAAGGTPI